MDWRGFYLRNERLCLSLAGLSEYLIGYFGVNWLSEGRPAATLQTAFDSAVPLIVPWVFVYSLAYPTCFAPALFVRQRQGMHLAFVSFTLTMLAGTAVFLAYPVVMLRPEVPPEATGAWLLALTYSIDKPYNCFPSLHVALDLIAALCCYRYNRPAGIGVGIVTLLISLSTLFVKQHYVLDVLAGFAIALGGFRAAEWLVLGPRTEMAPEGALLTRGGGLG